MSTHEPVSIYKCLNAHTHACTHSHVHVIFYTNIEKRAGKMRIKLTGKIDGRSKCCIKMLVLLGASGNTRRKN